MASSFRRREKRKSNDRKKQERKILLEDNWLKLLEERWCMKAGGANKYQQLILRLHSTEPIPINT